MKTNLEKKLAEIGVESLDMISGIEEVERNLANLVEAWDEMADSSIEATCAVVKEGEDWDIPLTEDEIADGILVKEVMTRMMHTLYLAETYAEYLLPRITYMRHEIGRRNRLVTVDKNGKKVI